MVTLPSRFEAALSAGALLAAALTLAAPAVAQRAAPPETRTPVVGTQTLRSPVVRSTPPFGALAVPEEGAGCEPAVAAADKPKMAFLNYFWHRPEEFQCTHLVPSDGLADADDSGFNGYYHRRFKRLKQFGVDVLGFVLTGFDQPDFNIDGEVASSTRHGKNLKNAIWLAEDVDLPFFIYYDLNVRTAIKQKVCKAPAPADLYTCPNPEHRPIAAYDLRRAAIYHQIRKDLLRIKDDFILPHMGTYYMLEDEEGGPVLDEAGLPRPVIAIYIARDIVPNNRIKRLLNFVVDKYREDGLGRPAFVLDTIFWNDPVHAGVVKRFGSNAVALTSFFPVNQVVADLRGVQRMVDWVPQMASLYAAAGSELAADPALRHLQVWPGVSTMFDNRKLRTRKCSGFNDPITPQMFWHLSSKEEWRTMLAMAYASTLALRPRCARAEAPGAPGDGSPIQSLVINYENEFRESAVTDCVRKTRDGRITYPYHFACELLRVVQEEDRWP